MLTIEKVNQLCISSYENAKSKGFHDREEEPEERIALLHSEISEAFEDFRNHKMALEFKDNGKPIGFPNEIADICIRVFDLFGKHNYKVDSLKYRHQYLQDEYSNMKSISWWCYEFHYHLRNTLYMGQNNKICYDFHELNMFLNLVLLFCDLYNIDIENAIEVKARYNSTRSFMHGGKAC